jgi:hypothetical protein
MKVYSTKNPEEQAAIINKHYGEEAHFVDPCVPIHALLPRPSLDSHSVCIRVAIRGAPKHYLPQSNISN